MGKNLVIDQWVEELSKSMAIESLNLLRSFGKARGGELTSKKLHASFVKFLIKEMVKESLLVKNESKLTSKEAYKVAYKSFQEMKSVIQLVIALGFEKAFEDFSNSYVEYYCKIEAVPEPVNKKPC